MNLPNLLSALRIALIPAILTLVALDLRWAAAALFAVTAATDLVDGYLARRYGLTSLLGSFLDPLADKLLVMALLVSFVASGTIPAWVAIVLLGRELAVNSLRSIASSEGITVAVGFVGKLKTTVQMAALFALIIEEGAFGVAGLVALYASVALSLFSGARYAMKAAAELRGRGED
jgi:CDP-diacylglycerol--glycerol-3-phosphate 3-phosphatidyltransferase